MLRRAAERAESRDAHARAQQKDGQPKLQQEPRGDGAPADGGAVDRGGGTGGEQQTEPAHRHPRLRAMAVECGDEGDVRGDKGGAQDEDRPQLKARDARARGN